MGRTNIVIDDSLIARAMTVTGARTKREAVEIALQHLVRQDAVFKAIRETRGQLPWSGDLDQWRQDRT